MNPTKTIFVLLLCFGAAIAFETFSFGQRLPGDRPLYFNTIETNETNAEYGVPVVFYEWFGSNQTFNYLYVEASSWYSATLEQPGSFYPLYERNFELEVISYDPTHLTVSFIVFGFIDQPPTHPGAGNANLLQKAESKVIERKLNKV